MSKIYHFHSLYLFIEVWILVSVGTNPISLGWRIGWFTLYKKCLHFLNWNIYLYLFANFQCCIEMTLSMALNKIYPLFKFLIAMSRKRASPVAQTVKNLPVVWETWVDPCFGKIPWRRKWKPTPVFLPGEFREQRSLVGYSPWGRKESGMGSQRFGHDWATNTHKLFGALRIYSLGMHHNKAAIFWTLYLHHVI